MGAHVTGDFALGELCKVITTYLREDLCRAQRDLMVFIVKEFTCHMDDRIDKDYYYYDD